VKSLDEEFCFQASRHLRDDFLPKIEKAVSSLDEPEVWWRPNEVSNSVGNLLLHLSGNVRQWIMGGLDQQPDTRTRDVEFAARGGYLKQQLLERLRTTVMEASTVIEGLTEEQLMAPLHVQSYDVSGVKAVIHVVEHFSYHVGQILFITKLLKNEDLGFYANLDAKHS